MFDTQGGGTTSEVRLSPLIQLRGVSRIYEMGSVRVRALDDVDLSITQGELVSVMGPSGSGKSTLMNVLGCMDRPTSGQYCLEGREISALTVDQLAEVRNQTFGFVFQSFNLLPRTTALENVELPMLYAGRGAKERRRRAKEALERVDLADRMDHHPNQLSGGQQQRVAIARAIANGPRLILADEPTGNLDSRTTVEIVRLFIQLVQAGITMVLVTHEPDVAAYGSRVVVMADGRISRDESQIPVVPPEERSP